jgi:hypothetical protein
MHVSDGVVLRVVNPQLERASDGSIRIESLFEAGDRFTSTPSKYRVSVLQGPHLTFTGHRVTSSVWRSIDIDLAERSWSPIMIDFSLYPPLGTVPSHRDYHVYIVIVPSRGSSGATEKGSYQQWHLHVRSFRSHVHSIVQIGIDKRLQLQAFPQIIRLPYDLKNNANATTNRKLLTEWFDNESILIACEPHHSLMKSSIQADHNLAWYLFLPSLNNNVIVATTTPDDNNNNSDDKEGQSIRIWYGTVADKTTNVITYPSLPSSKNTIQMEVELSPPDLSFMKNKYKIIVRDRDWQPGYLASVVDMIQHHVTSSIRPLTQIIVTYFLDNKDDDGNDEPYDGYNQHSKKGYRSFAGWMSPAHLSGGLIITTLSANNSPGSQLQVNIKARCYGHNGEWLVFTLNDTQMYHTLIPTSCRPRYVHYKEPLPPSRTMTVTSASKASEQSTTPPPPPPGTLPLPSWLLLPPSIPSTTSPSLYLSTSIYYVGLEWLTNQPIPCGHIVIASLWQWNKPFLLHHDDMGLSVVLQLPPSSLSSSTSSSLSSLTPTSTIALATSLSMSSALSIPVCEMVSVKMTRSISTLYEVSIGLRVWKIMSPDKQPHPLYLCIGIHDDSDDVIAVYYHAVDATAPSSSAPTTSPSGAAIAITDDSGNGSVSKINATGLRRPMAELTLVYGKRSSYPSTTPTIQYTFLHQG